MAASKLSTGVLSYGSGFDEEIARTQSFEENRTTARTRTASQVAYALRNGEDQVICAPPGAGKTHSILSQADSQSRTIILALQNYALVKEKAHEAREEHDASVLTLESAYRRCPSYTGDHGEELSETLRNCSLTPGRLHELSHSSEYDFCLPCTHGEECPYMAQFEQNFDAHDLIITTQGMLHASTITEERDVVIDEFSKDTYITEIENPRAVVNHFLEFIDSPFGVWGEVRQTDDMGAISSHKLQAVNNKAAWERECLKQTTDDQSKTHKDANLLVQALIAGDRYGNQIHCQLNSWTEVLITADSAKILERPRFEDAHAVIGLDATASERMWQKFCRTSMEVIEIVTDDEKAILWEQSGGELAVIGEYAHHASGGNIPVKPAKQIQSILRYTHGKTYTFSTKTVQDESTLTVDGYFGKDDRGTNEFGDADALLLVGAPHPGDREIIETAAWFGENALSPSRDHPDEMGVNLSYGSEIADDIFAQFREKRIEQAIYRGNRMDGSGLTVLSTTACVPEWMPVEDEMPTPRKPGEKEQAVLNALEELESASTREVADYIERESQAIASISERHVRRTLTKYVRVGIVTVGQHPEDGRVQIYTYGDLSISEVPENLTDIVRSGFSNDPCPIDRGSIRQAVETLMQLSWSDLDWAEWIVRQEMNGGDSAAGLT